MVDYEKAIFRTAAIFARPLCVAREAVPSVMILLYW